MNTIYIYIYIYIYMKFSVFVLGVIFNISVHLLLWSDEKVLKILMQYRLSPFDRIEWKTTLNISFYMK